MAIDPRQLANLLAVAKHGSFNRAAAALGLSQPALSNSIRQLERRLGVSVLDRTSSGSTLNEFGNILIRQAQTVEALLPLFEPDTHWEALDEDISIAGLLAGLRHIQGELAR